MTHRRGFQTVIGRRDKRTIEVVQINLAPGLKLMDIIEEPEREGGARAIPGSWKPSGTKELNATVARLFTVVVAKAVSDPHSMRSGDIKEREVKGRGGEGAWVVNVVTELIRQPQVKQSSVNEEIAIPLL